MENLRRKRFVFFSLLAMVLLFVAGSNVALAQVSASVSGRIEDASGAPVPGATVTVANRETGATRTATSDEAGNYLVLSLPVGRYDVNAVKAGFKTAVQTDLDLVVGQQAVLNMRLEVGEVQQQVTVTSEVMVVNTTTSSISGLVGEQQVKDLPLNGRSFDNLITLNTGAINYTKFTTQNSSGSGAGNEFVVMGRRAGDNQFLLNGVEYTGESNRSLTPGGVSGQLLGIDAVREFNVLTDAYSAQYGKRAGAQVIIVTQSGSNQIHGTAFEFLRNSVLDARNFFDAQPSQLGRRIPEFQRNQFGGALGGPIRRDKAFAFINYEGFRQRLGVSDVSVVPDANARLGLLPNAQGVPTPVTGFNPGMVPFFSLWPQPNGPVLGAGLAINTSSPKQSIREDFATVRLDQNLSSRDTLSEAATVDDGFSETPQQDPIFTGAYRIRDQVISLQEVHIFSPEKINTFRVGFSRGMFDFTDAPVVPLSSALNLYAGLAPGVVSIGGGLSGAGGTTTLTAAGTSDNLLHGVRNLFTYSDDFQLIKGKHQITFGVWLQRLQDNSDAAARKAGQASFSNLTTFLQGIVGTFQGTPDPHEIGYRMWEAAWYVEDTIKLRSNLTLTAGLRHEFNNTLNGVNGIAGNQQKGPDGIVVTAPIVGQIFTQNYDKWLFGPRVGLAWDVFGNGKTSIRSGGGIYYSTFDNDMYSLDTAAPFNTQYTTASNAPFLPLIPVKRGTQLLPPCNVGVPTLCAIIAAKGVMNNLTPTVEEWNLSVEQQISSNTSLRIAYVGSHGYHSQTSGDQNGIPPIICATSAGCVSGGLNAARGLVPQGTLYVPVATARPNPFLGNSGFQMMESNSNYNGLQVDLTHRLSHDLQFRANYTWSKCMAIKTESGNTQSGNSAPSLSQPYNASADYGLCASDVMHAATISGIYDLPVGNGKHWMGRASGAADKLVGGWQASSIVTLLSGFPFMALTGNNQSGNGDSNNPDRPSWNPNFTGPVITGDPNRWYNPNAFIIPTPGTFGNVPNEGGGRLRGPGLVEWDMSLLKNTSLTERTRLQFRAEFFNITNHTNFSFPVQTVFSGGTISPTAGLITATATTSRQIQFGLKFIF